MSRRERRTRAMRAAAVTISGTPGHGDTNARVHRRDAIAGQIAAASFRVNGQYDRAAAAVFASRATDALARNSGFYIPTGA